jgi:hypothetical protein
MPTAVLDEQSDTARRRNLADEEVETQHHAEPDRGRCRDDLQQRPSGRFLGGVTLAL